MQAAIAVLPSEVINQIAAGEVIERPASVVKELIDNSIDAGARTIAVETTGGGRTLIRVVDDGYGMAPNDAVLAFERHATSKLRAFDDLWDLTTMGFRGEALPAIASVSRLTLTTRRAEAVAATRVVVDSGRIESVVEVGAPVGTTVEVMNLLRNVPARLKFLKAEATEASHTTDVVAKIAMAYPAMHVRLRHNGRTALEVPPDRDVFARAQALLGRRTASQLVTSIGEDAGIRVTCVLGAPELAQTTARSVQLFVCRRPVRDRGLLHALCVGYGELVPRGRYPTAVLLVDPPIGSVDVNVHPQKAEVRFADPSAVYAAVRHLIQTTVARAPWHHESRVLPALVTAATEIAPSILPLDAPASDAAQRYAAERREARARPFSAARDHNPLDVDSIESSGLAGTSALPRSSQPLHIGAQTALGLAGGAARSWARDVKNRVRQFRAADAARISWPAVRDAEDARHSALRPQPQPSNAPEQLSTHDIAKDFRAREAGAGRESPDYFGSLRFLSQLDLTYWLCEGEGELVVIDQHIASEWVELGRLTRRTDPTIGEASPLESQRMLIPIELTAGPQLVTLAVTHTDLLAKLGFDIGRLRADAVSITAIPAGMSGCEPGRETQRADPTQLLCDILGRWAQSTEAYYLRSALTAIACRMAIPAGQAVTPDEAKRWLRALDGDDGSPTWLHGRPLLTRYTLEEIRRRFSLGGA